MAVDFRQQLTDQLDFIQASCDRYDQGHQREGVRIATQLRTLFHQGRGSATSLLTHLKANNISLLSTCDKRKVGQDYFPAMTKILLKPPDKRMEWIPKLKTDYERKVTFNEWWFREIVYYSKTLNVEINRCDLVRGAADKDGGAHVDNLLEPRYEQILAGFGFVMTVNPDGEPSVNVVCKNGHLAALRQMGYEVLNSPELLDLA